MRRIVGITYFTGELNDVFARYFEQAGFDVLAMEGMDVPFEMVGRPAPIACAPTEVRLRATARRATSTRVTALREHPAHTPRARW